MSLAMMAEALFADPFVTTAAEYYPQDNSGCFSIRVVAKQPDVLASFGEGQIHTSTALFDVAVKDMPQPSIGDRLVVGGVAYVVQSEPTADRERLIWTLNTRPE